MSYSVAVITISDKGYAGLREDTSGPAICALARENGFDVVHTAMVPDDMDMIRAELIRCADEKHVELVLTTGGTGFSPRDITPEATLAVVERATPGIPEAMRAASMQITPRGCLSRSAAGIRSRTLIVNLPGSKKAAIENLAAVIDPIRHGLDMLASAGSADCAGDAASAGSTAPAGAAVSVEDPAAGKQLAPSMDAWLQEAKSDASASECGMYLFHTGTVRATAKVRVREGQEAPPVSRMQFDYDAEKVAAAIDRTKAMPGIYYVRVWLNRGALDVGDDIMRVLIGGDIRPRVSEALDALVGELKNSCVSEQELY